MNRKSDRLIVEDQLRIEHKPIVPSAYKLFPFEKPYITKSLFEVILKTRGSWYDKRPRHFNRSSYNVNTKEILAYTLNIQVLPRAIMTIIVEAIVVVSIAYNKQLQSSLFARRFEAVKTDQNRPSSRTIPSGQFICIRL